MFRFRWLAVLATALLAALIGVLAYNAGVAHGIATSQIASGGATAPLQVPLYPYGWYRPWGFGFGFLGPFLFFALWFVLLRGLFWGGPWRRYRWQGGYYGGMPAFEEWHQRAHERMSQEAGRSPNDDDRSRR